jgi:hypothetical protein
MKPLPDFRTRPIDEVRSLLQRVFSHDPTGQQTHFVEVLPYADGHYRAVFSLEYFTLAAQHTAPSKSQWNNLKKRLKRHAPQAFIYKDYGTLPGEHGYLDFGFFAH